jgi:hypothetical protein
MMPTLWEQMTQDLSGNFNTGQQDLQNWMNQNPVHQAGSGNPAGYGAIYDYLQPSLGGPTPSPGGTGAANPIGTTPSVGYGSGQGQSGVQTGGEGGQEFSQQNYLESEFGPDPIEPTPNYNWQQMGNFDQDWMNALNPNTNWQDSSAVGFFSDMPYISSQEGLTVDYMADQYGFDTRQITESSDFTSTHYGWGNNEYMNIHELYPSYTTGPVETHYGKERHDSRMWDGYSEEEEEYFRNWLGRFGGGYGLNDHPGSDYSSISTYRLIGNEYGLRDVWAGDVMAWFHGQVSNNPAYTQQFIRGFNTDKIDPSTGTYEIWWDSEEIWKAYENEHYNVGMEDTMGHRMSMTGVDVTGGFDTSQGISEFGSLQQFNQDKWGNVEIDPNVEPYPGDDPGPDLGEIDAGYGGYSF